MPQINWPVYFKGVEVIKEKKKAMKFSQRGGGLENVIMKYSTRSQMGPEKTTMKLSVRNLYSMNKVHSNGENIILIKINFNNYTYVMKYFSLGNNK